MTQGRSANYWPHVRDILTNDDVFGATGDGKVFMPDAHRRAADDGALNSEYDPVYATLQPKPKSRWKPRKAA